MAGRGLNDPGDAAAEVPCRSQAKRGIADGGRASGGDPDRLSNGRALFNLVTGSDPAELAGDGVFSTTPSATRPRLNLPTSGAS